MSQPLKEDHGRTEAAGRGTCPAIQGRPHRRKPAACNVLSTGSPARTGRHQPGGGLTMADIRPYRSTPVFDQDTLPAALRARHDRSEEHTSELQSLMRISYAVFCLKKKKENE